MGNWYSFTTNVPYSPKFSCFDVIQLFCHKIFACISCSSHVVGMTTIFTNKSFAVQQFSLSHLLQSCYSVTYLLVVKVILVRSPWPQKNVHYLNLEWPTNFYLYQFHIIILPALFLCLLNFNPLLHFIIELQYNHVLTLWH